MFCLSDEKKNSQKKIFVVRKKMFLGYFMFGKCMSEEKIEKKIFLQRKIIMKKDEGFCSKYIDDSKYFIKNYGSDILALWVLVILLERKY